MYGVSKLGSTYGTMQRKVCDIFAFDVQIFLSNISSLTDYEMSEYMGEYILHGAVENACTNFLQIALVFARLTCKHAFITS